MVGKLPDAARAGRLGFAREGDLIALVGSFSPVAAGSELAKLLGERPAGALPVLDFEAARGAHEAVRRGVASGALTSAHDIAEGGIGVALAECCIAGEIGATVSLPEGLNEFAEAPGRAFVVSGSAEALDGFVVIGRVGGDSLELEGRRRRSAGTLKVAVSDLREAFEHGLVGFV